MGAERNKHLRDRKLFRILRDLDSLFDKIGRKKYEKRK